MNWKYLQSKFPWEMLLLIGGSFAMAAGIDVSAVSGGPDSAGPQPTRVQKSGLSKLIGDNLSKLSSLSPLALCVVATVLASTLTEFTTNAAAATILTPVLMAVVSARFPPLDPPDARRSTWQAEQLRINPLYLVMPAGFAVSYAFMLPIGTPANAMVFSLGILQVMDMVSPCLQCPTASRSRFTLRSRPGQSGLLRQHSDGLRHHRRNELARPRVVRGPEEPAVGAPQRYCHAQLHSDEPGHQ